MSFLDSSRTGLRGAAAAALGLWIATAALADGLPAPTGTVVLTVSGAISKTNDGDLARFDQAMLEQLEQAEFTTTTIWTEGPQTFKGVPLQALLDAVGAEGSTLQLTAINDYAVSIPVEPWPNGGPTIAYLRNGAPMPVRDKGPLWIVYPYDASKDFQSEVIYSRSIWQLDRIEIQP